MKAYSNYKDSGVQWIGEVPSHWNPCRFKNFVSLINTPSTDDNKIGLENIESGTGHFKETDSEFEGNGVQFVENDIVYGKLRPYLRKVWLATNKGNAVGDFFVFRANKSNPSYIHWLMLSDGFTSETNGSTYGAKMPRVSSDFILSMRYVLPPLLEQQVIASFLDAKTKPIDDIIAKREKQIELLEEMKSAIISRAVTKGLNSEAKMKDSGIEWIGEIPDHWDVKCIKYIKANVPNAFVDGPFGSNLKSQHYVEDGDVYVIESGFITSGKFEYVRDIKTITEEHFETIKRSECKENDIIIAKIGAYFGMAAVLPKLDKKSVVSGNSLKITLDNTIMLNDIFVYLMACSKKQNGYIGVVNETAQPALSLYNLNHFKLPVAPLEEQEAIASYLDSETSKIDTRIAKRRKQIELLQEYKQALITAAVTGKIDVREYNS